MLTALGHRHDGRPVAFFALTHVDLAALFSGQTLVVGLAEPGPEGMGIKGAPDVVLFVGESEESVLREMRNAGFDVDNPHGHGR